MTFSKTRPRLVLTFVGPLVVYLTSVTNAAVASDADALYEAAGRGNFQQVSALIDSGVDVNARTTDGSHALNNAAVENHTEVIRLLLDRGADPNVQNSQGDTPLICATKYAGGKADTVKLLVDAGTDLEIRDQEGKTALDYARAKGQEDAITLLEGGGG